MEIVQEITMSKPGGGFGAGRATVDYAQKKILTPEFLGLLAQLKVRTEKVVEGKRHLLGGTLTLTKEDLPDYFRTGEEGMNGAAHKFNQVFVAMEAPFYATSLTSDNAKKEENKVDVPYPEGHKKFGQTHKVAVPDQLSVYRISETFSIDFYAAEGSKKTLPKEEGGEGSGEYQEPTDDIRNYVTKWIEENGEEYADVLSKIGISIVVE